MFVIAVCDDNPAVCDQLEEILLQYAVQVRRNIGVEKFDSGEHLLDYILQVNAFDLIYLDIELGGISGVEVGQKIRKGLNDYRTEIVFISGRDSYDRQLFDVQPLNFIPKPIQKDLVIDALNLALVRAEEKSIVFQYQKGHDLIRVPVNDIVYFESLNRQIRIAYTDRDDLYYGNLDDVMKKLFGGHFIQIHRSYYINYDHVTVFRYSEVVMSNGAVLPVSRSKRPELRRFLMNQMQVSHR